MFTRAAPAAAPAARAAKAYSKGSASVTPAPRKNRRRCIDLDKLRAQRGIRALFRGRRHLVLVELVKNLDPLIKRLRVVRIPGKRGEVEAPFPGFPVVAADAMLGEKLLAALRHVGGASRRRQPQPGYGRKGTTAHETLPVALLGHEVGPDGLTAGRSRPMAAAIAARGFETVITVGC
jgi:hypothetical protein